MASQQVLLINPAAPLDHDDDDNNNGDLAASERPPRASMVDMGKRLATWIDISTAAAARLLAVHACV